MARINVDVNLRPRTEEVERKLNDVARQFSENVGKFTRGSFEQLINDYNRFIENVNRKNIEGVSQAISRLKSYEIVSDESVNLALKRFKVWQNYVKSGYDDLANYYKNAMRLSFDEVLEEGRRSVEQMSDVVKSGLGQISYTTRPRYTGAIVSPWWSNLDTEYFKDIGGEWSRLREILNRLYGRISIMSYGITGGGQMTLAQIGKFTESFVSSFSRIYRAVGVVIGVEVAKRLASYFGQFSGYLQATVKLLDTFVNLLFKPIADAIGMILIPFLLPLIRALLPLVRLWNRVSSSWMSSSGRTVVGGLAYGASVVGGYLIGGPVGAGISMITTPLVSYGITRIEQLTGVNVPDWMQGLVSAGTSLGIVAMISKGLGSLSNVATKVGTALGGLSSVATRLGGVLSNIGARLSALFGSVSGVLTRVTGLFTRLGSSLTGLVSVVGKVVAAFYAIAVIGYEIKEIVGMIRDIKDVSVGKVVESLYATFFGWRDNWKAWLKMIGGAFGTGFTLGQWGTAKKWWEEGTEELRRSIEGAKQINTNYPLMTYGTVTARQMFGSQPVLPVISGNQTVYNINVSVQGTYPEEIAREIARNVKLGGGG